MAMSHLLIGIWLPSNTVPTVTLNCFRHAAQQYSPLRAGALLPGFGVNRLGLRRQQRVELRLHRRELRHDVRTHRGRRYRSNRYPVRQRPPPLSAPTLQRVAYQRLARRFET